MPRRSRTELVWSIDHVSRMTSFSRTIVAALMEQRVIPSMVYQGHLITTQDAVMAFLNELLAGKHQSVMVNGSYPFAAHGVAPVAKPTTTALKQPLRRTQSPPGTDAAFAMIQSEIQKLVREGKSGVKRQSKNMQTSPCTNRHHENPR